MSFDPAFRFYTVAPEHGYPLHGSTAQRTEIRSVVEHGRTFWPARVAKGLMKREEMDRTLRIFAALLLDWDTAEHRANGPNATWAEQIHALRREIAWRRGLWPKLVLQARMTADDADRRLAVIEGIHDTWWHVNLPGAAEARADTEARARDAWIRAAA